MEAKARLPAGSGKGKIQKREYETNENNETNERL